jgi:ribosomal protein S12 methylthiotransferase accessory factor
VTSSGLATGLSDEDAALRATLELIERDAFMMTWLQRRPPQRLDAGRELGDRVLDVIAELAELGLPVELYLLASDIDVPTVMCVAWGDGQRRPAASVSLAADTDPIDAARKAVMEQAHVGPYVSRLMADESQRVPPRASEVKSLNDHALYYTRRRRLRSFDFVRATRGAKPVSLGRLSRPSGDRRAHCVTAIAEAGLRVAIADVTAPDVRLGPFRVARALGRYLQPIDFGFRNRRLANPRLATNGAQLNPDPHPLV